MIWGLVCNNMYWYECHFGSFYRDPTIIETVSIASQWVNTFAQTDWKAVFNEIQRKGIFPAPMWLCWGKMWKSDVMNIFSYHFPRPCVAKNATGQRRYCHGVVSSCCAIKHFYFQKLARLINHVRIYGSNVVEGFSVFKRRSCIFSHWKCRFHAW